MPKDFEKLIELTELVQAAEKAKEQRQSDLEVLLHSINDGYWDWHIPSNHEYMSPRFWEILGQDHTTKKHLPSEWMPLVHPDDLQGVLDSAQKHFDTQGAHPFIHEVRYIKPDGSIVWILCKGKVIEWDGNNPIRMVGTHSDITSLKGS